MKVSLVLYALLGLTQAFALPELKQTDAIELPGANLTDIGDGTSILAKREDEWIMVLYNNGESGGQCGGTSSRTSGGTDACVDKKTNVCADFGVNANAGIAGCYFNLKGSRDCSGSTKKQYVVQGGKDSNGVPLGDDIKFIQVACFKERKLAEE